MIGYLVAMVAIGWYAANRARTKSDFLLAGRRLGYVMYSGTMAAVVIGGGSTIGGVRLGYLYGISGAWLVLTIGLGVLGLSLLFASRINRLKIFTVSEMLRLRYGGASAAISGVVMCEGSSVSGACGANHKTQGDRERGHRACEGSSVSGACGANHKTQGDRERGHRACEGSSESELPVGPTDASRVPRFAGPATFARLPRRDQVGRCDIGVVGVPFDAGTSYRPGARFGPAAIRESSRLLRPYHPGLDVSPFSRAQVADCGDIVANPFAIDEALDQITEGAGALLADGTVPIVLGGDHTVALGVLRAMPEPVAVLHFDAHLDTWDTYFGARHTHGTPFRRAVEEGLVDTERLVHVGIRGPLYGPDDLDRDAALGYRVLSTMDIMELGVRAVAARILDVVGDAPLYVSVDIDVLDPAHAPGTGTPEAGGLTSRELLGILRLLTGARIVGADIVEVSPPYDHAEITSIAAAHVAYELICLVARRTGR